MARASVGEQLSDLTSLLYPLETVYKIETEEQGDGSENAEAAVNETPEWRNATERAGD